MDKNNRSTAKKHRGLMANAMIRCMGGGGGGGRLDKKTKHRVPVVRDKKGSNPFAAKKLVSPLVTDEEKRSTAPISRL